MPHGSHTVIRHSRRPMSNGAHFALTLITGGGWIPFWIWSRVRAGRTTIQRNSW